MLRGRFLKIGPKNIPKRLKPFNVVMKSKNALKSFFKNQKALTKIADKIFTKKGLIRAGTLATAGTALGLVVDNVWSFIHTNSGCFKEKTDGTLCKVKELSCCQPLAVGGVEVCDEVLGMVNVCDGYDESTEGSCCKNCDCDFYDCLPNETMKCQRPTVAEAVKHFASEVGMNLWSGLEWIFPWLAWLPYIAYAIVTVFIIYIVGFASYWFYRKRKEKQ